MINKTEEKQKPRIFLLWDQIKNDPDQHTNKEEKIK